MNSINNCKSKIFVKKLKLVYQPIKDIDFQHIYSWQIDLSKCNSQLNLKSKAQYIKIQQIKQFLQKNSEYAYNYQILVDKCILRNNYILKNYKINIKNQIIIPSIKSNLTVYENKNQFIKNNKIQTKFSGFIFRKKSINFKNQKKLKINKLFEQKKCIQPQLEVQTKSIQQSQLKYAVENQKKITQNLFQQKQNKSHPLFTLAQKTQNIQTDFDVLDQSMLKNIQTISDHKQKKSSQIIKFCRSLSPGIYNFMSKKIQFPLQKHITLNQTNKTNNKQLIHRYHNVLTPPSILNRKNQYLMSFQRMKSAIKHQTNSSYSTPKSNSNDFYDNFQKCLQFCQSTQIVNQYDDQKLIIIKSYKQFSQKNHLKKQNFNSQQKLINNAIPLNLNIHILLSKQFKDNKFKKKALKINFIDQIKNQLYKKSIINHYS